MTRLLLSVLLFTTYLFAAILPPFQAENLNGKRINMPSAVQGHSALLLIGFTQASGKQTADWAKKSTPICETWSAAVLEAAPRLLRGIISRGIKSGIPKTGYDRFLLVYQHEAELKKAAGFSTPDDAYVLLLAPDGSIRWRFHGPVSEEALDELRKQLE